MLFGVLLWLCAAAWSGIARGAGAPRGGGGNGVERDQFFFFRSSTWTSSTFLLFQGGHSPAVPAPPPLPSKPRSPCLECSPFPPRNNPNHKLKNQKTGRGPHLRLRPPRPRRRRHPRCQIQGRESGRRRAVGAVPREEGEAA